LTTEQEAAVQAVLNVEENCSIVAITGGPGAGKTTILRTVIERMKLAGIKFRLSSYTGKAVSRIVEQTKCSRKLASTLDRLIAKGDVNRYDHLIVDEASMVSSNLFYRFLEARRGGAMNGWGGFNLKLTLVGDIDQLPPIGWGDLFSSVLKAGRDGCMDFPVFRLSRNFRVETPADIPEISAYAVKEPPSHETFLKCSSIEDAAEEEGSKNLIDVFDLVRKGIVPQNGYSKQYTFVKGGSHSRVTETVERIITEEKAKAKTLSPGDEGFKNEEEIEKLTMACRFRIFAPYNRDVDVLNGVVGDMFRELQKSEDCDVFSDKEVSPDDYIIGDRVIMLKNVYGVSDAFAFQTGQVSILRTPQSVSSTAVKTEIDSEGGGNVLMNGDVGTVKNVTKDLIVVDFDTGNMCVDFSRRIPGWRETNDELKNNPDVPAETKPFDEDSGGGDGGVPLASKNSLHAGLIKHAFALTIHKSQGSVYDHVVVFIPKNAPGGNGGGQKSEFLNRSLFYTAITRAKKSVTVIVGGTPSSGFEADKILMDVISREYTERPGNLIDRCLIHG